MGGRSRARDLRFPRQQRTTASKAQTRPESPDGRRPPERVPARPSTAQLTFLFTDIEAITRAWERNPDTMSVSLARHDDLVHQPVEAAACTVFKHTGDGILADFSAAPAALAVP